MVGADTWIPFKAAPTDYYTAITVSIVSSTVYRIVTAGEWALKWSFYVTCASQYSHFLAWDLHTGAFTYDGSVIANSITKESASSFLLDMSKNLVGTTGWTVANQTGMSV